MWKFGLEPVENIGLVVIIKRLIGLVPNIALHVCPQDHIVSHLSF